MKKKSEKPGYDCSGANVSAGSAEEVVVLCTQGLLRKEEEKRVCSDYRKIDHLLNSAMQRNRRAWEVSLCRILLMKASSVNIELRWVTSARDGQALRIMPIQTERPYAKTGYLDRR